MNIFKNYKADSSDFHGMSKGVGEMGLEEVEYGLNVSGSGQDPVACSCDHSSKVQSR
jgi:hypothetical protein